MLQIADVSSECSSSERMRFFALYHTACLLTIHYLFAFGNYNLRCLHSATIFLDYVLIILDNNILLFFLNIVRVQSHKLGSLKNTLVNYHWQLLIPRNNFIAGEVDEMTLLA